MAAGDISKAMVAGIRQRIGDPGAVQVTDTELYGYLNDGQMEVVQEEAFDAALLPLTRLLKGVWDINKDDYSLPYDFLRERYVAVNWVPAKRVSLVEMDAIRNNSYFAASAANPFYSIANGLLRFYTGAEDPTTLEYQFYYVRKPMRVRAVTSLATSGNVAVVPTHGLTATNVAEGLWFEDVVWASGNSDGMYKLASVTDVSTIVVGASVPANGTGGRMIHSSMGQIAADEDPLVPRILQGPICDFAVARCREQLGHFDEAARQRAHFILRLEKLKQRYGKGLPFDGVPGDPGSRSGAE